MRRVVITGLGAVSPVGNDVNTFWQNLVNGQSGIRSISKFDTTDFKVKIAAEVVDFAPGNIFEKSELRNTDLFTQYAVAAAVEAWNDSELNSINPSRLGVYVGSGIGGISTLVNEMDKLNTKGPSRISPFFIPMMISNMATGKIAMRYKAQGPTLPVVTACATSTSCIGEAFRAIKHGYADAIIAGGSEAAILPITIAGFTSCMALSLNQSPIEACVPFDKRRNGFVMGEGAGIVMLEEYEHAKARNAKIYAEIAGYGNTSDAYHITAPHPEGEYAAEAISLSIKESELNCDHLYINAHGTSTPLNDKTETIAIKKALGSKAHSACISSTKSMTGHMLGAAGAIEAIAAVLALHSKTVPPTIGYREPDPDCDLDYVPNVARRADITSALSISLGFGGHNACIAFKCI